MNEIIRNKDQKKKCLSPCQKAHCSERAKCLRSMLTLKQREYSLERNLANLTANMKLDPEVLRPVLYNISDISRSRQIFLDDITRSLEEIAEELRAVKSIKESPETIQRLDTNVYKRRLVKLSQNIQKVEESCQLQTLSQERLILESELREFQVNLHKYESAPGSTGKSSSLAFSKGNKKCQDYKETQDFHALVAKTGHTENWSDEDHLLFVRLRKKCSNIPALVAAIQAKCPDLTAEMIVNHEAWYKTYLNLREKQRLAVREWRKQKEIEKLRNQEDETDVEDPIRISAKKVSSSSAKESPTRLTDNKCETKIPKTGGTVDNANQKKELIKRWRAEREERRLMDEEQSKSLMAAKLAAEEKRKKERLRRIQESLAEYRERKSMETSLETAERAPRYNAKLIKAFREQDEKYMNKKKHLMAKILKPNKTRKTGKVVGSQIARRRNHSTLLNSTKVWREKCKTQDLNAKEPRRLQYIKDVPRLWRNKESTEITSVLAFS